jgi:2-polyprenyl-3-methyl-5-hydroxy-6-metoxy-1,4-benzoquinol methylase
VRAGDRLTPELPDLFTVVRCHECGLAYQRPRPQAKTAGRFYPDSYTGGGRSGPVEALEAAYRRRQHGEVARWLAARRPARGRLLDVGCGAGDLLVALRADDWSVRGVEPSPPGAEQARDKHGLDVVTGRFEEVDLPKHSFDVVVFSGVLEHVQDPLDSLRRARTLLAPGGLLAVLFLPMLDSPEARLFGPRWLALDLPRHLTHFEDTTFMVMAARAGLEIVSRETYSRRHSAAQLVGSLAPGLQKHRFYRAESSESSSAGIASRLTPLAKRAAFLAATTAAKPVARLASAAGAPSVCSYFLEPAIGEDG